MELFDANGNTDKGVLKIKEFDPYNINKIIVEKTRESYGLHTVQVTLDFTNRESLTIINAFGMGSTLHQTRSLVAILISFNISQKKAEQLLTCKTARRIIFKIPHFKRRFGISFTPKQKTQAL